MLSVRPVTEADVPTVHAMIAELAEFELLTHEVVATAEDTRRALFGSSPSAAALIAEVGGNAAGFALFYPFYSTFAGRQGLYLEDLYVRPAFRKGGVGRALVNGFLQAARERQAPKVEWRVLRWNENAIRFYRSLGATLLDDWAPVRLVLGTEGSPPPRP